MIRCFSFGIAVLILASIAFTPAFSQPQPRFVSGVMQEGAEVQISGLDFGLQPKDDQVLQGVLVGDRPRWEDCNFRRLQPVDFWEDEVIQFRFLEEGLQEQQEFYLYVADTEGQVSSAIGPWMLGMGIVPDSGNRIPLEFNGVAWAPGGSFPGTVDFDSLQAPGPPQNAGWLQEDVSTDSLTDFKYHLLALGTTQGGAILARYSNDGTVLGLPQAWVGNSRSFNEGTWVQEIFFDEVQPDALICYSIVESPPAGEVLYLFLQDQSGEKSEGLRVEVVGTALGRPVLID